MADEGAAALKRMASLPFLQDPLWRTVLKFAVIVGWALATTVVSVPFFLALTPFRVQRIRLGNAIAYSWAWVVLFVIGVELEIAGLQHLRNPAIYIMNHTSSLDTMIAALISPWPAAGLAKKEVRLPGGRSRTPAAGGGRDGSGTDARRRGQVYFTPMGPLLWMGGGFAIDRSNRARAISTMDAVATFARSNRVGVWIWPGECQSGTARVPVGTLHRICGD